MKFKEIFGFFFMELLRLSKAKVKIKVKG